MATAVAAISRSATRVRLERPTARVAAKTRAYLAGGATFEEWQKDPFLALILYVQLREAFGWEAYKKAFAGYRALKPDERPKDDAAKRDAFMIRMSEATGRDLGPFFQAWGVPVSAEARRRTAGLPAWMPEGFPPK